MISLIELLILKIYLEMKHVLKKLTNINEIK